MSSKPPCIHTLEITKFLVKKKNKKKKGDGENHGSWRIVSPARLGLQDLREASPEDEKTKPREQEEKSPRVHLGQAGGLMFNNTAVGKENQGIAKKGPCLDPGSFITCTRASIT